MKFRTTIMLLAMLLLATSVAFAQDDDTAADDDTAMDDDTAADDDMDDDDTDVDAFTAEVDFSNPTALEADTSYAFAFTVSNTSVAGDLRRWINDVGMLLPSSDYVLDTGELDAPDALHPEFGSWEVETYSDQGLPGIRWMFTGVVTSESYGDIREQESLDFGFTAQTDADATDGFYWALMTDQSEFVDGIAFINDADDDTDDDDDTDGIDDDFDDDTDDGIGGGGDDDDDGGGGCGC
ncbi:hypothetical protein K8I61_03265 [bacterium]|nr:hypothetical protein [bacterium]